ncbi:hypothetical protein ES702_00721 [subsurface metagenome]
MSFFEGIFKAFPQIFENQTLIYAIVGVIILIGYFFLRKGEGKTKMKMFYFADVERLVSPLDVKELTPKRIITKDDKAFMRRAKSWLWKDKTKTFVFWLGKVGKGITYRIEQNTTDKKGKTVVEKIGSLADGIHSCLQLKEDEDLKTSDINDEAIEKLKKSEIFVCVDLEADTEKIPEITEEMAVKESDRNMMDLVGMKIKEHLRKEDWIRNSGLMAIGALTYIIATQLGLL